MNTVLSESESLMAWLDRRVENATCPATYRYYQKQFVQMWKEALPNEPIPTEYRDKVTQRYAAILKWD